MLQFVCENAMVLAIVAAFTSVTVALGHAMIGLASWFAY